MRLADGSVTVRFWAGARDAAGCDEEMACSGPVVVVLSELGRRHGRELARIIALSLVLVDGETVDRSGSQVVEPGAVLEVLPPFAGG